MYEPSSTLNTSANFKKIGFDIYPSGENVVQFDIEVFAKYRSDNLNVDVLTLLSVAWADKITLINNWN